MNGVVMLSQNERRHDSRVKREAEALAEAGYGVTVVCRSKDAASRCESDQGGRYLEVPRSFGIGRVRTARLLALHVQILLLIARTPVSIGFRARIVGRLLALCMLVGPVATALALSHLSRGRIRLQALIRPGQRYLEALTYVNDFAVSCGDLVAELRPEVIHAHDLITLSGGALVARRTGARLIYDAHELETHTNYHSLSATTKSWIAAYEAGLVRHADRIVTVCDSIADWLGREYRIGRPTVVINAPGRAVDRGRSLRSELGLGDGARLIVYVGSVTVDRGLERTIEALAEMNGDVHFATVGWRYEDTEKAMRDTAERLGVADRLHFVDPVPSSEVVPYIASADASVIPIQPVCLSYEFCFPNKLLESVFAGLPVAAADLVELRRFLESHPVGVVMDETAPASIAAALRTVLDARGRFVPSEHDLQAIEREYGWRTQASRLESLYDELVGSGGRRETLATAETPNLVS